jgi:hypothetical protein
LGVTYLELIDISVGIGTIELSPRSNIPQPLTDVRTENRDSLLDLPLELVGVLRVMGDIANGVDVLVTLDAEILIHGDTAVLLEFEAGSLRNDVAGPTPVPMMIRLAGRDGASLSWTEPQCDELDSEVSHGTSTLYRRRRKGTCPAGGSSRSRPSCGT